METYYNFKLLEPNEKPQYIKDRYRGDCTDSNQTGDKKSYP